MNIEINREDLLRMVNSVSPRSMLECDRLTKQGKMVYTGNQHNEKWNWTTKYLDSLSEEKLFNLYLKYK